MAISETSVGAICPKCGIEKPHIDFHVRKDLKSGHSSSCKDCVNKHRKTYRTEYSELIKSQKQKYYQTHKEYVLKRNRQWRMSNPQRAKELDRQWYEKNKIKQRDQKLQKAYKLNLIDYNELFIIQSGRCAICGKHQSEFRKAMGVDHNHNTGAIRGLLCGCCNRALGLFSDDIKLLKKATMYMEKQL